MDCGNCSQCGYPGWRRQVGQALEVAAERQVARTSWAERRSGPVQPGVGVRRSSLKPRPRLTGSTGGRGPGECDRAKGTGEPSPKWQGLRSAAPSAGRWGGGTRGSPQTQASVSAEGSEARGEPMAPGMVRGVGGGFVKSGWQTCVSGRPRPRGRADPGWVEGRSCAERLGPVGEEMRRSTRRVAFLRSRALFAQGSPVTLWWRGVPHTLSESWERGCLN